MPKRTRVKSTSKGTTPRSAGSARPARRPDTRPMKNTAAVPPSPIPAPAARVPAYPVGLLIDRPQAPLDRISTFFRPILAVPIVLILMLLGGSGGKYTTGIGILCLPTALMLLFRRKYPKWWFDWNQGLMNFGLRVGAYLFLLTDAYPSTDEEQVVHLRLPYPDAARSLSPGLPLIKWLLAVPHYVMLIVLGIAACFAVILAWFAILFTGRYPEALFDLVVGVQRWCLRVTAYAFLLTTDEYPPFRLGE